MADHNLEPPWGKLFQTFNRNRHKLEIDIAKKPSTILPVLAGPKKSIRKSRRKPSILTFRKSKMAIVTLSAFGVSRPMIAIHFRRKTPPLRDQDVISVVRGASNDLFLCSSVDDPTVIFITLRGRITREIPVVPADSTVSLISLAN